MRLVCAALLLVLSALPALAQREPEIVIPGRADVPVYINGIDASWGIVEGEFGLDRPGAVTPTVIYRPFAAAGPVGVPTYFPSSGKRPGYGRLEVPPPANRKLPPPAPSYFRNWTSESGPAPATEYSSSNWPSNLSVDVWRRSAPRKAHRTGPNNNKRGP